MDFRLGLAGAFKSQFDHESCSHTGSGNGANYRSPLILHDETSVILEKQKRDSFLGIVVVIVSSFAFALSINLNQEPFQSNFHVLNLAFTLSVAATVFSGMYFVSSGQPLWEKNRTIWHWVFIFIHPTMLFSSLFGYSYFQSQFPMIWFLLFPFSGGLFAFRFMNEQLSCSYPLVVSTNAVGFLCIFPPQLIYSELTAVAAAGQILFIIAVLSSILWLGAVRKSKLNTFRIIFWGSISATLVSATILLAANHWTIDYADPSTAVGVSLLVFICFLCLAKSALLLPLSHICVLSFFFPLGQCFVRWFVLNLPSPSIAYFGASLLTLTLLFTLQCLPETKATASVDWVDDRQDFSPNYQMIENLKLDPTDLSTGSLSTPHAKFSLGDLSLHYG